MSGNKLSTISIADSLSSCAKLRSIFLSRNPIEKAPNYRLIFASLIPSLEKLDGLPVDHQAQAKVSNGMILEAVALMKMIEEDIDDELRLESTILMEDTTSKTAAVQKNSSSPQLGLLPDTGSELTHGSTVVLAGNMAAAMRKRRNKLNNTFTSDINESNCDDNEDYESTLDVIDASSKLKQKSINTSNCDVGDNNSSNKSLFIQFFKEGDITSSMKGNSHMYEGVVDTSNNIVRPSSSIASPYMKRPSSASGKRLQHTSAGNVSLSFEVDAREANFSNSSTPKDISRRPKSALSSPHHNLFIPSPRQMNSSRPQSAAISTSSNVPFKVAINTNDARINKDDIKNLNTLSSDSTTTRSSIVHMDIVKRSAGLPRIFPTNSSNSSASSRLRNSGWDDNNYIDEDSDSEDIAINHSERHKLINSSADRHRNNSKKIFLFNSTPVPVSAPINGSGTSSRKSSIAEEKCPPILERDNSNSTFNSHKESVKAEDPMNSTVSSLVTDNTTSFIVYC